jgi:hypothetical protein
MVLGMMNAGLETQTGGNTMNKTVTAEQVALGYDPNQLIDHLNDTRRGGFLYIHGYKSKTTGEVANHWVQGACLYGNMKKRSIAIIDGDLMDKLKAEGLKVSRGLWVNDAGESNPTGRKSKAYKNHVSHVSKVYSMDNPEDAAKILVALYGGVDPVSNKVIKGVKEGLVAPKEVDQGYTQEAKGAYSKEGEKEGVLYFRDCLSVHKHVTTQGKYKETGGMEIIAIKEAIKQLLPIGRYTQFKLDGNFEYITVGGLSVIQGDNLSEWELALVETEAIHEAKAIPTAAALVDSILA